MELFSILAVLKQGISWVIEQATLLNADGTISDEDYARIKAEAGVSEAVWDERVAAAKARIASTAGE